MQDGSAKAAVDSIKQHMRVYPLAEAGAEHPARFVDLSGRDMNTIHANDFTFFEELDQSWKLNDIELVD